MGDVLKGRAWLKGGLWVQYFNVVLLSLMLTACVTAGGGGQMMPGAPSPAKGIVWKGSEDGAGEFMRPSGNSGDPLLLAEKNSLIDGRYRDNGDGTVTDTQTGLQWLRCPGWTRFDEGNHCYGTDGRSSDHTWDEAMRWVNDLNQNGGFAGQKDWRLPSAKELFSLVNCGNGVRGRYYGVATKLECGLELSSRGNVVNGTAFLSRPAGVWAEPELNAPVKVWLWDGFRAYNADYLKKPDQTGGVMLVRGKLKGQ